MNFGDSVIFIENGEEYNATVIGSRQVDDHEGSDGEPLLDLAFFKEVLGPDKKPIKVMGTSRQHELVQFRHDVAHESHEFSDKAAERLAGQYPSGFVGEGKKRKRTMIYPGGRWKEVEVSTFTGKMLDSGEDEAVN